MIAKKAQQKMMRELTRRDEHLIGALTQEIQLILKETEKRIRSPSLQIEDILTMEVPGRGNIAKLLTDHAKTTLALGQAHGDLLVHETLKKVAPHKLAEWQPSTIKLSPIQINPDKFWLHPKLALEALKARSILLADDFEGEILKESKKIMIDHLGGAPRAQTLERIKSLVGGSTSRAELIVVTETTYAYNRGRLAAYQSADVDYVEFSAVMDSRTSQQCSSRHGKIMRIDSAELAGNTPPLHGRCRSILLPIFSAYQKELLTDEALNWKEVIPVPESWKT